MISGHQGSFGSSRRVKRAAMSIMLAIATGACGSGETPVDVSTNPLLEPFIGTWDATVLTIRSVADTSIVVDLLENGVSYITIFDSGNYQSTIAFGSAPFTEFGSLDIAAGVLTLRPTNGDPITREYEFASANIVRLDGPTDWDFNLDEVDDPALLFMEMERR
ncbi:MAG: hypothetical protein L7S64_07470 [Longimicrobiales bacterium]|nr:hypothetical protein [Longimicrobiales bacterium]